MRSVLKSLANGVGTIAAWPLVVAWRAYQRLTGKETLFVTLSQLLSLAPGKAGAYLRRGFYRGALEGCGDDVLVGFLSVFVHPQVTIGRGVIISSGCTIGMVDIGDGVLIGNKVEVLSGRRQHGRNPDGSLSDAERPAFERMRIGEETWIGNCAVVMAHVGAGATVGAGSVVVKPVASGSTVVGNPAREIRKA